MYIFALANRCDMRAQSLRCVWLFATPWTVATTFLCPWDSPGKKTSELSFPPPGDLPDLGIETASPASPTLAGWATWEDSAAAAAAAKSHQLCPTLCDPRDGSPPGSPVPGILQARTLEWVAISFSNTWKSLSRVRLLATPWTAAYQAPPSMGFPRQKY